MSLSSVSFFSENYLVDRWGTVTLSSWQTLAAVWIGKPPLLLTFLLSWLCFRSYLSCCSFVAMAKFLTPCCRRREAHVQTNWVFCFQLYICDFHVLQALLASHTRKPFICGSIQAETILSFFNCKLRMLAAKLRGLLNPQAWQQLQKKLNCVQKDSFLQLLRCLSPNFSLSEDSEFPASDSQKSEKFPAFPTADVAAPALPLLTALQLNFDWQLCACFNLNSFFRICFFSEFNASGITSRGTASEESKEQGQ